MNKTLFKKLNEQMQLTEIHKSNIVIPESFDNDIIFGQYISNLNTLLSEDSISAIGIDDNKNFWLSDAYTNYLRKADAWQKEHDLTKVQKRKIARDEKRKKVEAAREEKLDKKKARKEEKITIKKSKQESKEAEQKRKDAEALQKTNATLSEYNNEYDTLNDGADEYANELKNAIKAKKSNGSNYTPDEDALADAYFEIDDRFDELADMNKDPYYSNLRLSNKKKDLKSIKFIELRDFERLFPTVVKKVENEY